MTKALAALFGLIAVASTGFGADPQPPTLRLDGTAVPQRYPLDLTVIPDRETFEGTIEIDVKLSRPTSLVWLNGSRIQVAEASIRAGSKSQSARAIAPGKEFHGLEVERVVPAGLATLRITYSGKFNQTGTSGLFRRQDSGNWYAFSDFEPLDARAAFPCFDEPVYKAPWQITLRVPSDMKALSNAPQVSESPGADNIKTVRFKETQPISSYLVALGVGPFDVVDAGVAGRKQTPLRIIVPKGRGPRTNFAREVTPKIFEALERYFGISYPFDKLDQIAFPMPFGAMENAGLITYGQEYLVIPPAGDSPIRQRQAASIIAHEISHQWFGNLATMSWWDDLWLNEAFATWMEARIVDEVLPDWRYLVTRQFDKAWAITLDTLSSARRVRQPIKDHGDIGQAFDRITYEGRFRHYDVRELYRGGEVPERRTGVPAKTQVGEHDCFGLPVGSVVSFR